MYNIDSLKEGIKKCDENIKVFEDAIKKERDTQEEYREMIKVLEKKEPSKVIKIDGN